MKKMMFNDRFGQTDAVIESIKKQTRRLMKNQCGNLVGQIRYTKNGNALVYVRADFDNGISEDCRYAIGEIVAVAQNYNDVYGFDWKTSARPDYFTAKDFAEMITGWNNKMFVKADLMPHHIRILDVRAERLHEITEDDCLREGILFKETRVWCNAEEHFITDYLFINSNYVHPTAKEAYAALIDKISGKGTWERSPWVWRIEFELIK